MHKKMVVAAFLAVLMALAVTQGAPTRAAVSGVGAVQLIGGLEFPSGFVVADDGRIFYGERFSGEVRIYDPSDGSDSLFFTIPDIVQDGARGLIGMTLSPNYPTDPYVFAYATRLVSGIERHQILRMQDDGGTGSNLIVIWTGNFVAGPSHPGGPIKFGPDGKLYAIPGDGANAANAQDLSNDAGKLLRMTRNGGVPPGNPIAGSRIWSYGIRSSYGFDFDPLTGFVWESENGPTCNDEINRLEMGKNYGWGPNFTCNVPPTAPRGTNRAGPNPVRPQAFFTPTIAPTGLAFCVGCGIASAEGSFLWGTFNDFVLRQCDLSADRTKVIATTPVYTHWDSILSVERGADGAIYLSDFQGLWKLIEI